VARFNFKILEQKSILEKLECSLSRTKRLTKSVQNEIYDLQTKNASLQESSDQHCINLESTLEDAKQTQRELEKIEKMFRHNMSTKCYKPL